MDKFNTVLTDRDRVREKERKDLLKKSSIGTLFLVSDENGECDKSFSRCDDDCSIWQGSIYNILFFNFTHTHIMCNNFLRKRKEKEVLYMR